MQQVVAVAFVCWFFLAGHAVLGDDLEYSPAERSHWSLQPRQQPAVPQVADTDWVRNPVDAFILRRLEQAGLRPASQADRRTLLRRVRFDLTGLPPAPAEIDRFVRDEAAGACERLVDRLLASPEYGEQWGQHWLDVVRYAETEGFEYDRHRPGAWRYRDYVIAALNADKPYDRFVLEQLAGDEIGGDRDGLIAAGFQRLGPVRRNAGNAAVAFSRNEVLTERTNSVGTAFLGLTLACARCHDHMFDAIRQRDYYRMQAFLAASYEFNETLAGPQQQRQWQALTDRLTGEINQIKLALKTADAERERELQEKLKTAEAGLPPPLPTISTVQNDPQRRTPVHLLLRGDPQRPADPVAPRYLGVLLAEGAAELAADLAKPRTALANWIVNPDHPLTARVIVNRIWQYHFGVGLVATANDFGVNGESPSHPELLDYLANELVRQGWRIKPIHRLILTSNTYRQASRGSTLERAANQDPDNRLLWHVTRRRLAAHEIRDAMLAVSGMLDRRMAGPSVMVAVDPELVALLYKPSQWRVSDRAADHDRRSVYLMAKRNLRLPFMEVFDQPDLQTSCPRRESSTHSPQALELLNGELANRSAAAFARRLRREAGEDPVAQVRWGFELATARRPTADEQAVAVKFLATQPLEEFSLAVFNLNAFLYVE